MSTKAFKNDKIEEIKGSALKAKVAIVADYRGLSVAEITDLRRQLQKEGADFTITKNTLAKNAFKGTQCEGLEEFMQGPSAVTFGFADQVAPAKVLTQYAKQYAKKSKKELPIKGGVIDGKILTADDVKKLAELPSKEELLAKILGSINSPASGIVYTINGVMSNLVRAIDEVRKQKQA